MRLLMRRSFLRVQLFLGLGALSKYVCFLQAQIQITHSSSKEIGAVTGGVGGGLVVLGTVISMLFYIRRKRERKTAEQHQEATPAILDTYSDGEPGSRPNTPLPG